MTNVSVTKRKTFIRCITALLILGTCLIAMAPGLTAYAAELDGLPATGMAPEQGELPSQYCMRDEYIIYAQNQDKHGLCWNFASIMAASTAIMKATGEYYDFSEIWTGLSAYIYLEEYRKIGDGGYLSTSYDAIKKGGLMLESDFPYDESFYISNENANDFYNFYSKYADYGLSSCIAYDSETSFDPKDVDKIKRHIYEHGSVYMAFDFRQGYVESTNGISWYLPPNQTNPNSAHAVSIIGWDDDYQETLTLSTGEVKTFKGAWLLLNSYTEKSGTDGISYLFYDDTNITDAHGYRYEADTTGDFYFYDKIEAGYAYPVDLAGKYYGDFVGKSVTTKQKNIFYDDVALTYSYTAPSDVEVEGVSIYLGTDDVTADFAVTIDNADKRFSISRSNADYGHYKVLVRYGNGERSDAYLNNFFVTHGLVGEEIEYDCDNNELGFNTGRDLEFYSYSSSDKNYVIYTSKESGSISFLETPQSVYSEKNMSVPPISYEIGSDGTCSRKHTVTSLSGYELVYNFEFKYSNDSSLMPVSVYYDLAGGVNHPENYDRELASAESALVLYEPSRAGYTFEGWYLDYGGGSKKLEKDGDHYYVSWDDIHHMGESPTLFARSYYKTYYKNSNTLFVYAHWAEDEYYDVTLQIAGGGSSQLEESISVRSEDSVRYIFEPDAGYCLSEIKINGVAVSADKLTEIVKYGLLLEGIETDTEILATFSKGTYLALELGDNIKTAYITKTVGDNVLKIYNGGYVPGEYTSAAYLNQFTLVVELEDAPDGYTYLLENVSEYEIVEKGIFKKQISIHRGYEIEEIYVGSAESRSVEDVRVSYSVPANAASHYLSLDTDAASGDKDWGWYSGGDTVYLFIRLPADTDIYSYSAPAGFESIGDRWVRKAFYVNPDGADLGKFNIVSEIREYTVIWKNQDGSVIYSETYEFGSYPQYYYSGGGGDSLRPSKTEDERYTYTFAGWSPLVSEVIGDATYTAQFSATPKEYSVTVEQPEHGTVTAPSGSSINCLDEHTYIFEADDGYRIKDVLINGSSVGPVSSYTFFDVCSDQTVSVELERITFTVSVACTDGGSCDVTDGTTVDYGSSLYVTITPNESFEITWVKVNGRSIDPAESLTVEDITEDVLLEISFAQIEFDISTSSSGNGSVTPSASVSAGEDKTIDFTADEGYRIKDVKIDGTSIGAPSSYTFFGVSAPHTVSVEYEAIKYSVTVNTVGEGSVSGDKPLEDVLFGEDRAITVSPADGWQLLGVYLGGKPATLTDGKLTVDDVSADISVLVIFSEIPSEPIVPDGPTDPDDSTVPEEPTAPEGPADTDDPGASAKAGEAFIVVMLLISSSLALTVSAATAILAIRIRKRKSDE